MEMSHNNLPQDEKAQLNKKLWNRVLQAAVDAQKLVPEAIAAGGTAAALYANHRLSVDTDHLLMNLSDQFESVQETLEASPNWKTARIQPPVLILGAINGMEVGFRQSRRSLPIETTEIETSAGKIRVPTLDEILGMKAYLSYSRRTTRDFLDFAAMSSLLSEKEVLQTLLRSDKRYGELQSTSVSFEIAKALHEAEPYDLSKVNLEHYKSIQPPWNQWQHVEGVCRMFGEKFGEALVLAEKGQ